MASINCSRCGKQGHIRSNRKCPLFITNPSFRVIHEKVRKEPKPKPKSEPEPKPKPKPKPEPEPKSEPEPIQSFCKDDKELVMMDLLFGDLDMSDFVEDVILNRPNFRKRQYAESKDVEYADSGIWG